MVRVSEWVVTLGSRGDSKAIKNFEELLMYCFTIFLCGVPVMRIRGSVVLTRQQTYPRQSFPELMYHVRINGGL